MYTSIVISGETGVTWLKWREKTREGNMDEKEIGRVVRTRRKQIGLTQDDVARLAGTHRQTILSLEDGGGERGVTLGTLIAAADVLGLRVNVGPAED
jgi:DNA-binding XRE family transcriptional regulator